MVFVPVKLSNLPLSSPEVRRQKLRLKDSGDAGRGLLRNDKGESVLNKFSFPSFSSRSNSSRSSRSKLGEPDNHDFGNLLDNYSRGSNEDEETIDPFFESPSVLGGSVMGYSTQGEETTWQNESSMLGGMHANDHYDEDVDPSTGLFEEESERGNRGLDFGTVSVVSSHRDGDSITYETERENQSYVADSAHDDGATYESADEYYSYDETTVSHTPTRRSYDERYQEIRQTKTQATSLIQSPLKSPQKLLSLADHGDWSGLEDLQKEKMRKSTDKKTRQLDTVPYLDDDDDSSSSSSEESTISVASPLIDILEDDDDESVVEAKIEKDDDRAVVRRKVSRMSSGQLRRWDGFKDQVEELVRQAMPENVDEVSKLMKQFAGREAELIKTLENMISRYPRRKQRTNRAAIPRSRAIQGSRHVTFVKMDAIASIAAASTLDDNTLSIRPELVIDDSCTIKPSSKDSFFESATGDDYGSEESENSDNDEYSSNDDDSSSYYDDDSSSGTDDGDYSRASSRKENWNYR